MPEIVLRALVGLGIAIPFAFLLVAKNDKQLVNILQGRAYKLGINKCSARKLFDMKKRFIDAVVFAVGVSLATFALLLVEMEPLPRWIGVALGVLIMGVSAKNRLRSFKQAEAALQAMAHKSR